MRKSAIYAALLLCLWNFKFSTVYVPFVGRLGLGALSVPVTVLWIVTVTNALLDTTGVAVSLELELLQIIAGLAAVFGHIWTVFAGFKGGKGVGTGAGMILGILPQAVLAAVIVFIIVVFLTRYVSLGSILGSLTILIYLLIQKFVLSQAVSSSLLIFGICIPVLIIFTHRTNVVRLFKGTENKISFKKS